MGWYSRVVFPRLCEWVLKQPYVARHRQALLAQADGQILEIGLGTGLNLPHYSKHVQQITAVDPNPGMHHQVQARIDELGLTVDKRLIGGEELPFDSEGFDCVVSTFTLCSIEHVERALAEIHRVLKPGGKFLLLEHGLSPDPAVARWQRRLNRMQKWLADNCHLDRDVRRLVAAQPYRSVLLEDFYLEKIPRTHGYLSTGVATK